MLVILSEITVRLRVLETQIGKPALESASFSKQILENGWLAPSRLGKSAKSLGAARRSAKNGDFRLEMGWLEVRFLVGYWETHLTSQPAIFQYPTRKRTSS